MAKEKIVNIDEVNLFDDELFREILGRECGYDFMCYFIEAFYGFEKGSLNGILELVPQGSIPADVYRIKSMTGDLLARFNDTYADIEVYTSYSKYQNSKDGSYLIQVGAYIMGRGQDYNEFENIDLISLASKIDQTVKVNGVITKNQLDRLRFYLVDVDRIDELLYNNSRSKDFVDCIKFMLANRKERARLAKGDERLMKLNEEIEKFINSEEYVKNLSRRARDLQCEREEGRDEGIELGRTEGIELGRTEGIELGRTEGIELGRDENQRETVMNMFNEDFTLEQISAATKLSLDAINTIIADSKK